jgi:hypothetical protein
LSGRFALWLLLLQFVGHTIWQQVVSLCCDCCLPIYCPLIPAHANRTRFSKNVTVSDRMHGFFSFIDDSFIDRWRRGCSANAEHIGNICIGWPITKASHAKRRASIQL